ncbi:hypothetical protein BDW22DRAFT_1363112 [Trametopsis cervina]|nr:hypothetical protein BDW22DRAFT_1363112 [Trametopsis cervina]
MSSPRHLQDNTILGAGPASRPPSRATQSAFTNETYEATAAAANSTDQGNGTPITFKPKQDVNWPVPHIIVNYQGRRYAWGRSTLRRAGPKQCYEWFSKAYCTGGFQEQKQFQEKALLMASLFYTHGCGDDGLVILQSVGWEEVIENVMEIYISVPEYKPHNDNVAHRLSFNSDFGVAVARSVSPMV